MRVIIRPVIDRQREIDLTHRLIAAIAEELWRRYGGNEQLNWLEAEMHLHQIMGAARVEAGATAALHAEPPVTTALAGVPAVEAEPAAADTRRARCSTRSRARTWPDHAPHGLVTARWRSAREEKQDDRPLGTGRGGRAGKPCSGA